MEFALVHGPTGFDPKHPTCFNPQYPDGPLPGVIPEERTRSSP